MQDQLIELCQKKTNKELHLSWQNLADEYGYSSGESLRTKWKKVRKQNGTLPSRDVKVSEDVQNKLNEIDLKILELQKEKVKLQTEKTEIRRWIRNCSRIELLSEKLENAIQILKPLHIPQLVNKTTGQTIGITAIADAHVGKEILIKGLHNEIINKYNYEIFEQRMWTFLNKLIHIIEKERLSEVYVMALGDLIDGILRIGSLVTAEHGVVDSIMMTSEFLSHWLNELSEYAIVHFYTTLGNHSECRFLSSKSGELAEENLEKIIHWFISSRLKDNVNVHIHSCANVAFTNIFDVNILSIHGQNEKGLDQSIKDYSIVYNQRINLLLSGHLHSFNSKSVGMNVEYIQFPSICGADEYSMKLRKCDNAGSKTIVLDNNGEKIVYDVDLQRV